MCDICLEVLLWQSQGIILILSELLSSINNASAAFCILHSDLLRKHNLIRWLPLDEAQRSDFGVKPSVLRLLFCSRLLALQSLRL